MRTARRYQALRWFALVGGGWRALCPIPTIPSSTTCADRVRNGEKSTCLVPKNMSADPSPIRDRTGRRVGQEVQRSLRITPNGVTAENLQLASLRRRPLWVNRVVGGLRADFRPMSAVPPLASELLCRDGWSRWAKSGPRSYDSGPRSYDRRESGSVRAPDISLRRNDPSAGRGLRV